MVKNKIDCTSAWSAFKSMSESSNMTHKEKNVLRQYINQLEDDLHIVQHKMRPLRIEYRNDKLQFVIYLRRADYSLKQIFYYNKYNGLLSFFFIRFKIGLIKIH